ncbi:hypothetical protein AAFC00_001042 [Neodothiora populina]|uniref:FCH domain-containing protein n=1 Tax=Neodothiora populina TaxID=2781224 RepID=A0ABR3PML3_9PEZI
MDRQEYPAMLATLHPAQAIDVLNDRVKQVGSLNAHIADWLAERKRLEEQYSSGLKKLARRAPPGDANELGVFSVPWHSLTTALESIADSHHTFASKIEADVEKPLRSFALQDRGMQAMSTIQGNLSSLARDIESAEKNKERLASKGQRAKTMNVANATNELEIAQSQWDNQAPYVFEQLQAVDETRLNKLRDVLTQFQTHEVDRVEKDRTQAEQCLNVILNVETADEIKTFALRVTQGRPVTTQTHASRGSVGHAGPTFTAPSPHHTYHDDTVSQRSDSIPAEPEKKSGGLKGLKRLGTVLGRRRESKIILPTRTGSESPERRPKPSAFNSFTGRLGRGHNMPAPLEESEESPSRPRSPLRKITSADDNQEPIDGSAQSLAAAGLMPESSERSNGNGINGYQGHQADVAQLQAPMQPSAPQYAQPSSRDSDGPRDSEGFSLPPAHLDAISQAEREAADGSSPAYHVNIRNAPIAEEGNDDVTLATLASTLKMQGPASSTRRAGTVRGRRDMRASVYAPSPNMTPEPVAEESSSSGYAFSDRTPASPTTRELDQAFSPAPATQTLAPPSASSHQNSASYRPMSSASAFSAPQSPSSPGFASQSSPRGGDSSFSPYHRTPQEAALAAFNRPDTASAFGSHATMSDNQSLRSERSSARSESALGASKHPVMHNPGLNSSIIETVSAWFENGQCTRSAVIGEIALAYNTPHDTYSPAAGQETIRLENFGRLEKVAPNPSFISEGATKGEYTVNVSNLRRTGIAFKFQMAPPTHGSISDRAPLLMESSWKITDGVAMCIVSYSLNPAYAFLSREPNTESSTLSLNNLTILLHLGSDKAKATSCQSKPVGAFDRARHLIYWDFGGANVTLSRKPVKLLAKFVTSEGEARPGNIEAKWEMTVPSSSSSSDGLAVALKEDGAAATAADPFADADAESASNNGAQWKIVEGPRKVCAAVGGYVSVP